MRVCVCGYDVCYRKWKILKLVYIIVLYCVVLCFSPAAWLVRLCYVVLCVVLSFVLYDWECVDFGWDGMGWILGGWEWILDEFGFLMMMMIGRFEWVRKGGMERELILGCETRLVSVETMMMIITGGDAIREKKFSGRRDGCSLR